MAIKSTRWRNWAQNPTLPESYDALLEEKKNLDFWTKKKTFNIIQRTLQEKDDHGNLTFHNGPPFSTGPPHFGHILNGLVKDILTRYGFQKQVQAGNQFGWDCHGIAIEHEVNKKLGIKTPEGIESMGVAAYNAECRKFVQRFEPEWRKTFDRLAFWVDFEKTYSTMSMEYMEGVWGIFKELFDKGLVYKDTKVLPFSTGCFTHLSNFEANQNVKEVCVIGAIVSLNIVNSSAKLLIWTSAPWKLLANVAVCVNSKLWYVKVKRFVDGSVYILSKNRLPFVFQDSGDYIIEEEIEGENLKNLRYEPLFGHFSENKSEKIFHVLVDEFVRDDIGTGIAALSPYFADDDYRVCLKSGIALDEVLCPIDDTGHFKEHITELAGLDFIRANDHIIEKLQKQKTFVMLDYSHRKKSHCWRTGLRLVNKLTQTWFVRVKELRRKVLENNATVKWINGDRNVLMNAHYKQCDAWSIGRKKFWGTPIPIWTSPSGDETRCIGSVDELLQLTGKTTLPDLHREFIDYMQIPSKTPGNPPLRRVPEIFDCWFESAVMPFIQSRNQADFIAEGRDQIYGWFYTTAILSAALNKPPPSRNLLLHGLVLHTDRSKLSKHKHNQVDFERLTRKFGADALRLYLSTTPLMSGRDFSIQDGDIYKMNEDVIQPIYDAFREVYPYFGKVGYISYTMVPNCDFYPNIFDRWILSRTESLLRFYDAELKAYRVHAIIPELVKYIQQVRDWYIPIRRTRRDDKKFHDFFTVVLVFVYKSIFMLAPFAPFFAEYIFQIIHPFVHVVDGNFVHITNFPAPAVDHVRLDVESTIRKFQQIVEMVRKMRVNQTIPIQYRISELIIVHPLENCLEDNQMLIESLMRVVNVQEIRTSHDRSEFGGKLKAFLKSCPSVEQWIGPTNLKKISSSLSQLGDQEVEQVMRAGSFEVNEYTISLDDIQIVYDFDKELEKTTAIASTDDTFIVVRMKKNLEYYEEGTRLELISAIRKFRKKANVFPSEKVSLYYSTKDNCLQRAFQKFAAYLSESTNSDLIENDTKGSDMLQETVNVKGVPVTLLMSRKSESAEFPLKM